MNILIPALGNSESGERLKLAAALLDCYGGEGTVLSVVEVPEQRSLSEGTLIVRRRRSLLRKLEQQHGNPALRAEVHTAHSLEEGIRQAVRDSASNLLLLEWSPARRRLYAGTLERLIERPPCDCAIFKRGKDEPIRSIMVPLRGGPHARLALQVAEGIARQCQAELTLLHITVPDWDEKRRAREEEYYTEIRAEMTYARARVVEAEATSVQQALLSHGEMHDLVVMGAAARDDRSSTLFGQIPEAVARQLTSAVVVVKTREPVTAETFGVARSYQVAARHRSISELVDSWFAENTFHSHEFRNIRYLVDLKERQGHSISLALPALNEEKTVGKIITVIKRQLMDRFPLLDEIVLIDSNSEDRTVQVAEALGIPVYKHPEILPEEGTYRGKGEGLWKSLQVTRGDIVVWIDSDITGIHPKFVYGLVGPLLTQSHIGFVKGFYRRPLKIGGELLTTGGGRVTELTARPMINLFYPELSGLVQPLAGEMAGRRSILESVPFFTGYGVETGLLIDILDGFGLRAIAQADLEYRVHRNQSLLSLSKMAFAIIQVVIKRLGDRRRIELLEEVNTSMKLIHYSPTELFLEVMEIQEHERPAIKSLVQYVSRAPVRLDAPTASSA